MTQSEFNQTVISLAIDEGNGSSTLTMRLLCKYTGLSPTEAQKKLKKLNNDIAQYGKRVVVHDTIFPEKGPAVSREGWKLPETPGYIRPEKKPLVTPTAPTKHVKEIQREKRVAKRWEQLENL